MSKKFFSGGIGPRFDFGCNQDNHETPSVVPGKQVDHPDFTVEIDAHGLGVDVGVDAQAFFEAVRAVVNQIANLGGPYTSS
ncbi:MAG TPA: hypothetical protein EYG46_01485 [Myxococcales bacterium]|nr:hypothetical protein [Myxococcales bacterium]